MRTSESSRDRRALRSSRLKPLFATLVASSALALSGCNTVVLHPSGDVAQQQGDMVVISTLLMLIIIVPVIIATLWFAWRYRASNTKAKYDPHWEHSTQLELMIWAAPLLIIVCLGALTWVGSHMLDPYRRLSRIDASTPVTANMKPLEVDVVALDWKWLFIYPEQKIATVNELVVPKGREIAFKITASNVMNSFYVPALAGQIYAMPGMETKLHAAFSKTGTFKGFSANYSGAGFPYMHFKVHSVTDADFAKWAGSVQGATLDRATYLQLAKPSEKVPVIHYGKVDPSLYGAIVGMCVKPGQLCASQMRSTGKAHGDHIMDGKGDAATTSHAAVADNSAHAPVPAGALKGAGLSLPGAPQSLRNAEAQRRADTAVADPVKGPAGAASRNPS